jgi:hypothetical protein
MEKNMIDSPLLLHMQHHSTTITPLFLRLPKVKILPRDPKKKKKSQRILNFQILLQGNEEPPLRALAIDALYVILFSIFREIFKKTTKTYSHHILYI